MPTQKVFETIQHGDGQGRKPTRIIADLLMSNVVTPDVVEHCLIYTEISSIGEHRHGRR